jgi:hypothetical protein
MTPKHWRRVRIVPDGRRFKLVTYYAFIDLTDGDARALGFERAKDFRQLTKARALEVGDEVEKALADGEPRKRLKMHEINVLQNTEAKFTLRA